MRKNLEEGEHIVASLPQVWGIALGFRGFFHKNKEGVLALTDRNLIFTPLFLYITPKEKGKYFEDDKAKIAKISNYTEDDLDEDISENSKSSWVIPLESIRDVEITISRKVSFLRVTYTEDGKTRKCDFGIAKTVASYPQRQPLVFKNLDWTLWLGLIKSMIKL